MNQNSNDHHYFASTLIECGFEILIESIGWIIGSFADIG